MADRMFDFNQIKDEEQARIEEAAGEKTAAGWTRLSELQDTADAAHPLMLLEDPEKKLPEQAVGVFLNPVRGTAFAWTDGKRDANVSGRDKEGHDLRFPIAGMDPRFIALEKWLGENHVSLRLCGEHTDRGYAVLDMQAVTPDGERIQPERDSFLQLVLRRLMESRAPEEASSGEDRTSERESSAAPITDLNSMLNFLACAGHTLPENMRAWAERNVATIRSSTISPEERRHAERALQLVLNIQWKGDYFESIDPVKARAILDEELYGLERVKQRIMETIIQINRTHTLPSYGLLLAGPAGIGKSQLAYAVARILKLPWTSLDMSAIHDSEALTGSPRVYANAKPGRIMEAFAQSGASNTVFIINELDKADHNSINGNPADALLTLLDNIGYTDNYIECRIPTNGVYPVATANDKNRISAPLMSRFAVIDIPDYTPEEKRTIFRRFSLPKVLKRMGMRPEECIVEDRAVDVILEKYRDDTGCRDLEQAAEHLAANALYQIETTGVSSVRFDAHTTRMLLF